MDLIKCPDCGEMYSSTYPRCPFCEEDGDSSRKIRYKPKRRLADRHKAQSARGALIAVLVLVLALLGFYLFGDDIIRAVDKPAAAQQGGEPVAPVGVPVANEDPFYQPADPNAPVDPDALDVPPPDGAEPTPGEPAAGGDGVDVSNAKLNRDDFTLGYAGEKFTIQLSGTEAEPRWSIDNGNVASIAADGTVRALANGTTTVHCQVGSRDLTCTVRVCNTGKTAQSADAPTVAEVIVPTAPAQPSSPEPPAAPSEPATPAEPAAPAQPTTPAQPSSGTHVDASALKVKTSYGTVLQKDPHTGYPDCTMSLGGGSLTLQITGTGVPVSSWSSDKTSVVEVSADGKLKPVARGTAHVTAKVGDAEVICIIRVQ
ncbi:MAG: hypothetical protein E7474_14360 [Ruminococcaceae bacterium]|nr:hypothetical protein [Oscillospiraceae bacterium]